MDTHDAVESDMAVLDQERRELVPLKKGEIMAGYNDVFERKEIKHVITAQQFELLQEALRGRMQIDAYGKSQITSIYYDTPQWELIERSLDKPTYKEKLRVRIYGNPTDARTAEAFVEIKKKYKGIVYKRRVRMTLAAVQAYFGGMSYEDACNAYPLADPEAYAASLSTRSLQIAREIDQFRSFYQPLEPSMGIAVQRSAYAPVPEASQDLATSGLRITVDECAQYCNLKEAGAQYHDLMEPGMCILEIKAIGAMPMWLVKFLDEAEIFPSSFSKYGEAYKTVMRQSRAQKTSRPSMAFAKSTRRQSDKAHEVSDRRVAAHANPTARRVVAPRKRKSVFSN